MASACTLSNSTFFEVEGCVTTVSMCQCDKDKLAPLVPPNRMSSNTTRDQRNFGGSLLLILLALAVWKYFPVSFMSQNPISNMEPEGGRYSVG